MAASRFSLVVPGILPMMLLSGETAMAVGLAGSLTQSLVLQPAMADSSAGELLPSHFHLFILLTFDQFPPPANESLLFLSPCALQNIFPASRG